MSTTMLGLLKLVNKCSLFFSLFLPLSIDLLYSDFFFLFVCFSKSSGQEAEELLLDFCPFSKAFLLLVPLVPTRKSLA